ncbi:uncharacterized protein [Dermacentor albipictus]|uniref:uncharacterized protein n=1 Tax=Dermacentor albipictus TaxID=60249 RepID=UPI0038FD1843
MTSRRDILQLSGRIEGFTGSAVQPDSVATPGSWLLRNRILPVVSSTEDVEASAVVTVENSQETGAAYPEFGRDSDAVELPQLRVLSAWYCSLPARTGPCEAYIGRFYYNVNTDTCEDFLYGGCEGNKNNFRTYDQCHAACHPLRGALARA